MLHAIDPPAQTPRGNDSSVAAIARETETAPEIVRTLYDRHFSALNAQARVKQFVSVIVSKLVKDQLRALRRQH